MRHSYGSRGRLVAAALASLLGLAACSTPGVDAATEAGPPVSGGALTFATDIESPCWDPHQSPADVTALVQRNVFDSLVSGDRNGSFHPWLAASWTIAQDGKSYTFKLREDVKFHDGATFDAAAVKANFDHIVDPATKSQYAASLLGPYTGTTVVDPYTVRVEFSAPFRPFLQAASTPYLGFYSPAALSARKDSLCGDSSAWVGTGPFKAASYTKTQSIEFTRNAAYRWGPANVEHKEAPYLDKLSIRFLPDNAVRVGALNSGEVDVIGSLPPVSVAAVKANPALQFIRQDAAGGNYLLFLNVTRPVLADVRVRQAILAGVDLDALIKSVYFGQYNRPWGPISPATPFYEPAVENSWGFDQAKANGLLDSAGWTGRDAQGYRTRDGQRLTLNWPAIPAFNRDSRDTFGQGIQADLKKVGIEVSRPGLTLDAAIGDLIAGKLDVIDLSWVRADPDILRQFFLTGNVLAKGGQNYGYVSDPQIDEWVRQGTGSTDPAVLKQVYSNVQRRVVDQAYVLPGYVPAYLIGAKKGVHGLVYDPNAWPLFSGVWRTKS